MFLSFYSLFKKACHNTITYKGRPFNTISILEFENGKVVRETHRFAEPFEPPGWRSMG
ncbi:MAG: hypothetical protein ABSE48_18265 [Verrucomicrobiota bacterium]